MTQDSSSPPPAAARTRSPRDPRDIWLASLLAVGIVGLVYLPLAIATVGTGAHTATAGGRTPLVLLAGQVFGPNASRVVGIAGLLLSFIPLNAYVAGTSRLSFATPSHFRKSGRE